MANKYAQTILIQAKDEATKTIVSVANRLVELAQKNKNAFNPQELKKYNGELKQLSKELKTQSQIFTSYGKMIDTETKTYINGIKARKEENNAAHKERMNQLEAEMREEKKRHQEEMNHVKERKATEDAKTAEIRRQTAEFKLQQMQQDEALKKDKERLKAWQDLGSTLKSVGSTMSGLGKSMIGIGTGTIGAVTTGANKYIDTFIELDRVLSIKGQKQLGSKSVENWNNYIIAAAKKYGVSSSTLADASATTASGSGLYNTADVLPMQAKMELTTGADATSLGNIGVLYDTYYKHIGFNTAEDVGDYYTVFNDLSTATPAANVKRMGETAVFTSEFDKYDQYGTGKVMALASKRSTGDPGLSYIATGMRQFYGSDALKKAIIPSVHGIAEMYGMSVADYVSKATGLNVNNLDSLNDLYKLGTVGYADLVVKMRDDIKRLDGTMVKNAGTDDEEIILANDIQRDYFSDFLSSTRSNFFLGAYGGTSAEDRKEVMSAFEKGNVKGRLNEAYSTFENTDLGRLKKSMNSISENFMTILSKLAPMMAGFMEKIKEWTDVFADMNFEELVEYGGQLAETVKTLIQLGIGFFIIGKATTMLSNFITIGSGVVGLLNKFGFSTKDLTYKLGRYWYATMTNWTLGTNHGLKGMSMLAGGAATTAGKMAVLGVEVVALTGMIIWCYNAIKKLVDDFAEFGKSKEYLQGREDAYNKKDTDAAEAYNKMNSTALGNFYNNLSNGDYLGAVGDLTSTFSLSNLMGGGTSYLLTYGSTLQGKEDLNFVEKMLASGYSGYDKLSKWASEKNNPLLDAVLETISPDYKAYNSNNDKLEDVYNEHQGNYVEDGLADAESYFNKKEVEDFDKLREEFMKSYEDLGDLTLMNPEEDLIDINDLEGIIEDGTEKGTEKGVKNALQGHFNTPDTYNILGQVGLGQLNQYEGFGIKKQGNQTVVNNNNVSIHIDGGNPEEIKRAIEKLFGGTGALSGATSYAYN